MATANKKKKERSALNSPLVLSSEECPVVAEAHRARMVFEQRAASAAVDLFEACVLARPLIPYDAVVVNVTNGKTSRKYIRDILDAAIRKVRGL